MLSQNDRHRLEEMERHLQREDPEWVGRFTVPPPRLGGAGRALPVVVVVVGVIAMILSLLALLPAVFFLLLVATVAAVLWLRRRRPRASGWPRG